MLKLFRSRWLAAFWLLIMTVLFVLPGSAFPEERWFDKVYFDKWVHVGLFAVLLFLWRSSIASPIKSYSMMLLCIALLYGLSIEVIQGAWVPNRSADIFDVVADMTGSLLGILMWQGVYKKNKPL
jgi:VanZ family protein